MPNSIAFDSNGIMTCLKVIYKTEYGTRFEVDGDLTRVLKVNGSDRYVSN